MTLEEHVRILHGLLRRDHEEWVAEVESRADNAAARGDLAGQRRNLDHIALMESRPKPWEPNQRE